MPKLVKTPLDKQLSTIEASSNLSYRQIIWCNAFIETGCLKKACDIAGFSHKISVNYGNQLLKKPAIQLYLVKLQEEKARYNSIQKETIVDELVNIAKIAMSNNNQMAAIAAWKEIAKMMGYSNATVNQLITVNNEVSKQKDLVDNMIQSTAFEIVDNTEETNAS